MPTISTFYGIVVQMYWDEHAPAHFHAYYQGAEGVYAIRSGEVIVGYLPPGAKRLVVAWAERHREELLSNWDMGMLLQPFDRIVGADEE